MFPDEVYCLDRECGYGEPIATGLDWDDIGKVYTCQHCGKSGVLVYDETWIEETNNEYTHLWLEPVEEGSDATKED